MKLKKSCVALAVLGAVSFTPILGSATGIPVIDVASIAEIVKQLVEMEKQFSELQAQTGLSTEQLRSMTGARGMADLVNDPTSRYYIPAEYRDVLRLTAGVSGGDYDDLQTRISDLSDASKILDISETGFKPDSKEGQAFVSDQNQIALNSALAERAYDSANRRTAKLQVLLDKVNHTNDPKEIADLNARISAEQLMLTNETNKLVALKQNQDAYWQRQEQRTKEERIKALGQKDPTPLDW